MVRLVTVIANIVSAIVAAVAMARKKNRTARVRTDPAGEWVRARGGADKRASSGSGNAGGAGDR